MNNSRYLSQIKFARASTIVKTDIGKKLCFHAANITLCTGVKLNGGISSVPECPYPAQSAHPPVLYTGDNKAARAPAHHHAVIVFSVTKIPARRNGEQRPDRRYRADCYWR